MEEFDLAQMAKEAGVNVDKVLRAIETTKTQEDELYSLIFPIISGWLVAINEIATVYAANAAASALTETIIQNSISNANFSAIQTIETFRGQSEGWADRLEQWHRKKWVGVVRGGVRLDITPILQQGDVEAIVRGQTRQNVNLITKLSDEIRGRIETIVWESYKNGDTGEDLAKKLRDEIGFSKSRSRLIAADQLGKFSGVLDKARQEQAGITHYIWRTVGDERVRRPTHTSKHNKKFAWSDPPNDTGHPGQDIRCRCKARAFVEIE